MAFACKMGRLNFKRFVCATMGVVEMVVVHSGAERLSGFANILETLLITEQLDSIMSMKTR